MKIKPDYCKAKVYPTDTWGAFHPHQCKFKAVKDGYCKIHHPDAVEKRRKEKNKREEARRKASCFYRLGNALNKIIELEAEITKLKKKLDKKKQSEMREGEFLKSVME